MPIVTFYVGPDKAVFHVHQNLLFDASPVFKAGFSGNFKEASERSMTLPDDDKDLVGSMIQWLYTQKLHLTMPVSMETSNVCYMKLAKLNALAEKYDIRSLKNDIIDKIFDLGPSSKDLKPPQIPPTKYVYDTTSERSSFRKLLVAWNAYHIDCAWYERDTTRNVLAGGSPDFVLDLVMEFGLRQKYPNRKSPFTRPSKDFHELAPNEPQKEVD